MSDAFGLAASVTALAVFVVIDGLLLIDALYQVVFAKPSLLPLQRLIRRREPATAQDCVYEGAAKAFNGVGLATLILPMAAVQLFTALSGPNANRMLANVPRPAGLLMVVWVGFFVLAMTCFVLGLALALRVKYVPLAEAVKRDKISDGQV